jgi:hypothetical protein
MPTSQAWWFTDAAIPCGQAPELVDLLLASKDSWLLIMMLQRTYGSSSRWTMCHCQIRGN